jgi:hypothetical protein
MEEKEEHSQASTRTLGETEKTLVPLPKHLFFQSKERKIGVASFFFFLSRWHTFKKLLDLLDRYSKHMRGEWLLSVAFFFLLPCDKKKRARINCFVLFSRIRKKLPRSQFHLQSLTINHTT